MKVSLPRQNLARLGLAPEKREYDLPFHDDRAGRFLILLIGLMTYLAILSGAGGMVLTSMAARWSTGLANHMTIEVPVLDQNGTHLTNAQHQEKITALHTWLVANPAVRTVKVEDPAAVAKLVEPWLGSDQKILGQMPLPALLSVTLIGDTGKVIGPLQIGIQNIVPTAKIETHQSWLNDVLRLTSTLSFAAYLIGLITTVTTVSAVSGAVRARMAAFHEQLEILHLIGASDEYITRQFQKHALQLSFMGAGIGFLLAMMTLVLIDNLAGTVDLALVPALILSGKAFIILLAIPILTCLITVFTTRLTVLQTLQDMP